jgi:hypothetical protein
LTRRWSIRALLVAGGLIVACQDARDARASKDQGVRVVEPAARLVAMHQDTVPSFTVPPQCARGPLPTPRPRVRPPTRPDSAHLSHTDRAARRAIGDTVHVIAAWRDSAHDTVGSVAATRADTVVRADSAARPESAPASRAAAAAPARLPGSLFPGCRVVAYYGNPLSKRMGILGEIAPDSMLARLARQAAAYSAVDSARPVLPALELIATVAQASPGKGSLYRLRMPDTLIARVAGWAEAHHYLLILDVQTGRSTVAAEIAPLMKYLARPYVHLALDPEFSVSAKKVPGKVIGRMDAAEVNIASGILAGLVDSLHLPPKMLIVHRFTTPMLSNHEKIKLDPRVQIVIDMDGFGPPHLKKGSYKSYVHDRPVQFAGFKLFYKNDKPMLTPAQVLELDPVPLFIMYQ